MSASSDLRVHILGIGQADAVVIELPNGELGVVDFGHRLLIDYLQRLDPAENRRFAFCLLTHAHHDHYACLEEFIDRFDKRVDRYWCSMVDPGSVPALLRLKGALLHKRQGAVEIVVLEEDAQVAPLSLGGVLLYRFGPPSRVLLQAPRTSGSAENNRSVVLLMRHGASAVLLGADAEASRWQTIERQAQASSTNLAVDLVKAPHHGANAPKGMPASLWPALLRTPQTLVAVTAGRAAGKPHVKTIEAFRGRAVVHCTGRALTCRPLVQQTGPRTTQAPRDLLDQALAPAPEDNIPLPCFGTQVYRLSATGAITCDHASTPAWLDACTPQT